MIQASGSGDPQGAWSQQFTYDGFGNLTQKIGNNAPNNITINVDPTTNRLTGNGAVYDANGNLTQYTNTLSNMTFTYDGANRLATASGWNGGSGQAIYGYDASNQRVYSNITSGGVTTETFFFYGADGKKLGLWTISSSTDTFTLVSLNTWFGGRLLKPQDRLNSIGKYFPYGEDRYSPSPANPPNGQEKFATYTRDAETGLDYAYQRYYTAGLGRFMTPDPLAASASVTSPQTQNRYPYANNDPANNADPAGTDAICGLNGNWDGEGCSGAGYYAASTATSVDPFAVYASSGMQVAYGCLVNQQDGFLPIAICTGDPNFAPGQSQQTLPPKPSCQITVASTGAPKNQNIVGATPYSPPTNALGKYTTVGQHLGPLYQGWFFAVQIQGSLSGDTNPADWAATQSVSSTGSMTLNRVGVGAVTIPFASSKPNDDPVQNVTYRAPGVVDWLDAPGWSMYQGSSILIGASLTQNFTSTLTDGGATCSVSWTLTFTLTSSGWNYKFKLN